MPAKSGRFSVFCLILFPAMLFAQAWQQIPGVAVGTTVNQILTAKNGSIYVATEDSGLYRSTTNGSSWTKCSLPGSAGDGADRALLEDSQARLFCANRTGGLYRSTDNGGTWTTVNTGLPGTNIYALGLDSRNDNIYSGDSHEYICRSTTHGDSWTTLGEGSLGPRGIMGVLIDPTNGYIYAGTDGGTSSGCFISKDGGTSFQPITLTGAPAGASYRLGMKSDGTVFISAYNGTIYRSTDHGTSWTSLSAGVGYFFIPAIGPLYFGGMGVSSSIDNFTTITPVGTGLTSSRTGAVGKTATGALLVGVNGTGLFILNSTGVVWNRAARGPGVSKAAATCCMVKGGRRQGAAGAFSISGRAVNKAKTLPSGMYIRK